MPGLRTVNYGTGDFRWLLNTDGVRYTTTMTLDPSAFTAGAHYPKGFFPAGLILNGADPKAAKPFTGAAGEKFVVLDGDYPTNGTEKIQVSVMTRGQLKTNFLPVKTNLPATAPAGFYFTAGA